MSFFGDAFSTITDVATLGAAYGSRKAFGLSNEDIASGLFMPYGVTRGALGLLGGGGGAGQIPPLLAPPLPPDATDEQIRQAVLMQRRRLLLGQGQGSTFVSGPLGDASSFATSKSSAGGF